MSRIASLLVCTLLAVPSLAAGQGSIAPVERIADEAGTSRRYAELTRLAGAEIERALLLESDDEEGRMPHIVEAERYARVAVQLMPEQADGWFLVAASVGMRSEFESTRRQVQLAAEIWAAADSALARDPEHAGAHHVLGRLNFEAMRLSGFARLIATHLFGSTLMRRASWEQAESHFAKAAAAAPGVSVHRVWLGRLHEERGDRASARRLYQSVIDDPADTELERRWRDEALELLENL